MLDPNSVGRFVVSVHWGICQPCVRHAVGMFFVETDMRHAWARHGLGLCYMCIPDEFCKLAGPISRLGAHFSF